MTVPVLKTTTLLGISYKELGDRVVNNDEIIKTILVNESGIRKIAPTLTVRTKDNELELKLFANQADISQNILNSYLNQLSDLLRKRDLESIDIKKKANQHMLERIKDPFLKDRLYLDMISLNNQEIVARKAEFVGFDLIDPPSVTNKIKVDISIKTEKSQPADQKVVDQKAIEIQDRLKKRKIIVPVLILSFFLSTVLAVFIEYLKNLRIRNPEKFQVLKDYARLRTK